MNPILARFHHEPALVAPQSVSWFEACLRETARTMEAKADVLEARADGFWFDADDYRSAYRPYVVDAGVLMIPVKGSLLNNFPYAFGNYATGYDYIWQAFRRGLADADVKGIALCIDSPGGMVAGCFDLVDRMFAARGAKPVRAFAHESAYSAAYAIASAADSITVSRTGGVGSIGVLTMHVDQSKMLDDMGLKVTLIFAGKHKVDGNPFEALPEDVRARTQARIDALYDVFVATVARNRDMDEQAVRDTEAECFMAAESLDKGLADEIGTLEDSLLAFAASLNIEQENETMADISQADIDTARATGVTDGATAERARINAILASDPAKARPKAALSAALRTNMSAEDATAFLADLPEEPKAEAPAETAGAPTGMFAAAMAGSANPDLGAGNGAADEMSVADRILANAGKSKRPARA